LRRSKSTHTHGEPGANSVDIWQAIGRIGAARCNFDSESAHFLGGA